MDEELGVVKQICELDENGAVCSIDGRCFNISRKCCECPYYHEIWNTRALINGLKWILEDDKFSFGENWEPGMKPESEEENAGYIICRVIEHLEKNMESKLKDPQ